MPPGLWARTSKTENLYQKWSLNVNSAGITGKQLGQIVWSFLSRVLYNILQRWHWRKFEVQVKLNCSNHVWWGKQRLCSSEDVRYWVHGDDKAIWLFWLSVIRYADNWSLLASRFTCRHLSDKVNQKHSSLFSHTLCSINLSWPKIRVQFVLSRMFRVQFAQLNFVKFNQKHPYFCFLSCCTVSSSFKSLINFL